jgi:glucose/mannose-6-phosphate isomerase
MKKLIESFPEQLAEALEIAAKHSYSPLNNNINNIVICGLGGSGITAKIISHWFNNEINIPIILVNDYSLPNFVNENTLVIGSSYSGETEETIFAVNEAKDKGAPIFCITSGGYLAEFCKQNAYDIAIVPGGKPPRSAIAYSLVYLTNFFKFHGFIGNQILLDLNSTVALLLGENKFIKEKAKELADFLFGKVGVFYSESKYEGVLIRSRQQFNENAKYLCWSHVIPEMNHNELVGWGGGDERFAPVFFVAPDFHERNLFRFEITKKTVENKAKTIFLVEARGNSLVERYLYFIHLVDWASFYLCELNKVDILEIDIINYLKSELGKL